MAHELAMISSTVESESGCKSFELFCNDKTGVVSPDRESEVC